MDPKLEQLAAYNVVNMSRRVSLLNSRPLVIPFQNTATPTPVGTTQSAIITVGDRPWLLNHIELGTITASGNTLPSSLYLQFNLYDQDNLGLFGGRSPRASTVFGAPIQIPYAIQPVKVFSPKTRLKLEWTNQNPTLPLGFELFLCGIEILDDSLAQFGPDDTDELKEAIDELIYERRVR
jgi:hypothetical protein